MISGQFVPHHKKFLGIFLIGSSLELNADFAEGTHQGGTEAEGWVDHLNRLNAYIAWVRRAGLRPEIRQLPVVKEVIATALEARFKLR